MSTLSPTLKVTTTTNIVTLAAGCFWGVEAAFRRQFKGKGLVDIKVGYANGNPSLESVTYEKVCTGTTNFIEAVQISFEPSQLPLSQIYEIFFRIHDPTQAGGQGPDIGTQYISAILTHSDEQSKIAAEVKEKMQKEWYPNNKIATKIEPIKNWFDAETYHQSYLNKNPGGYECPTHFLRTSPKI